MINITEQAELFRLLGAKLDEKVDCLAIGGSAMMFYGAKTETKDVDLVFLEKKSLETIKKALFESGFNERKNIRHIFARYDLAKNKPLMMEGFYTRFDLFVNEVIGFRISATVVGRVKEIHEFGNLIVRIISPEDIILMKCATEREKDRNDAASLIEKFNIDWSIVLEESMHQTQIGGDVFSAFLFDFLYELKQDFKANIPEEVIKKTMKIAGRIIEAKMKKGTIVRVTKYNKPLH